jgi:imidazoleglycerol-phosphate dehydratase
VTTARTRQAARSRQTRETSIAVELDVDGSGRTEVSTAPFFDHMLGGPVATAA